MPRVSVTLYAIPPSHPAHAARLMLEHKGIPHKVVNFVPGTHAVSTPDTQLDGVLLARQ